MVAAVRHFALMLAMVVSIPLGSTPLQGAETAVPNSGTAWDATVNTLLATGMYGVSNTMLEGLSIHLQRADNTLPGFPLAQSPLSTQAITFSYEGSSGLLEFSAGYILTQAPTDQRSGSIFLGIEPDGEDGTFDPEGSWYLSLGLSRSYQMGDDLALSLGNRAIVFQNPFDIREGHLFSLLFSMPITYKKSLTVTPELQWTRPLSPAAADSSPDSSSTGTGSPKGDVFYGGVSIRFAY